MEAFNATQGAHGLPDLPVKPASLFTLGNLAGAAIVYVFAYGILAAIRKPSIPDSIPWVGREGKGWLAGLIATFKSTIHYKEWNNYGYEKYNKANRSFVVPNLPGAAAEIILPRSQMKWLIDQPDNVLSVSEAHYTQLHGEYSFITPQLLKDPYHEHVIHRSLARHLNALIPDIEDEAMVAVDDLLGLDTENWKSFNVWDMFIDIIPRITNRMMIGLPVARDKHYLANMVGFTNDIVRNMLLLSICPEALKPVVGRLAGTLPWYHWRQTARHSIPIVKQRLHDFSRKEAGDPAYKDWTPPNDYVSWHIKVAMAENRQDELDPSMITKRLTPINFASIHTTCLTALSTIIDLVASDPSRGFLAGIEEECTRVWKEENGNTTKDSLSRLYRTDSAIRESMRVSNFAQTIVGRVVVAPQGITNEAEGWHAPKGTMLTMNVHNIMHDPELYDQPESYDAFRHSREREAWEAKGAEEKTDKEEALRLRQKGMVTTGDTHFPWGHGRHACPGRFFVAHELKILISYLVRNYEIKHLEKRPETKWFGMNMIPATDTRIEIRRKKGTMKA
ncbi:cytochrome P450 monooxygenase-like protein 19 [Elsinoe australis]|uniref:Cytochrome P450 monooxygenase-like protein 19 n=1 Tax=Elsinoe australis TaxID=40998 RepID=A0A4U7B0V1_9PEZI|nr:cytochrome P450 monooxygenase-like protein 19 [Elsinoe australis]